MSYPTRYTAVSCDHHCWSRACMRPGEDKGSFQQGRGYTTYHGRPKPVCLTRHLHGCPDIIPEPNPEVARCCYRPDYRKRGDAPVRWRTCAICGSHAPQWAYPALNALPSLPGVPCTHMAAKPALLTGWWECQDCTPWGTWDHRPLFFEVSQFTREEFLEEFGRRLNRVEKG